MNFVLKSYLCFFSAAFAFIELDKPWWRATCPISTRGGMGRDIYWYQRNRLLNLGGGV